MVAENTDENIEAIENEFIDSMITVYLGGENKTIDVSNITEDLILEFGYPFIPPEKLEEEGIEFGVWIDGEILNPDDYTAEEGSTKITLANQTITNRYNGDHTITAGYHIKDNRSSQRTAQNFKTTGGRDKPSNNPGGSSGIGLQHLKKLVMNLQAGILTLLLQNLLIRIQQK